MKRTLSLVSGLVIAALWFVHRGSSPAVIPLDTRPDIHRSVVATPALPGVISRASDEWQGMPVDEQQAQCDTSERCGLATACIAGRCGGCSADRDCASSEACVLDHCVRSELVACRSRSECRGDELCVLSGISSDARGNGDMRAYCQGAKTEIAQTRETYETNARTRVGIAAPPREVTPQALLDTL